jgi:hypothetical protein
MPNRHRYATRDELTQLLVDDSLGDLDADTVGKVFDALEAQGVRTQALVKIMVVEDVAPDLQ